MTTLKKPGYILCLLFATLTLAITLQSITDTFSLAALGFLAWGILPYGLLMLFIKAARSKPAVLIMLTVSFLAGIFGLAIIYDAMYITKDAQAGLVFVVGPLWQSIGILIICVPALLLNRLKSKS